MRKTSLLLLLVLLTMQFKALAERINVPGLGIPKLIITEVRPDAQATAYIEITNMGDTAINLAPFIIHSVNSNTRPEAYSDSIIKFNRANSATDGTIGKVYLKGILLPGESYVVSSVWEADNSRKSGVPYHNTAIATIGKQFVHKAETSNTYGWINKPIWQCFGKDSVSLLGQNLIAESSAGYLIQWQYTNSLGAKDSTYIDQFNFFHYPTETGSLKGGQVFPIAGIVNAMTSSIMVRKSTITKGNLNWNQSRGTDVLTSEWLVIPKNSSKNMAFTSAGVHGKYDLSYSVNDPTKVILNEAAKTISVQWRTVRGDSLARFFNLGKGMAWSYQQSDVFADSASYIVRPGDKFSLYAVGEELKKVEYTLQVRDADPSLAVVFPRRTLNPVLNLVLNPITGRNDSLYTYRWSTGFRYALSEAVEMDSIINIPFATRVDTLLKYLDKPLKAKWEIEFVGGQRRLDLKLGDKLKVTSENGNTVKKYALAINEYVKGNNALLSTVTWPDLDVNKYPRWNKGDTLPEFAPLKNQYIVDLAYDAKQVPALQFKAQDLRAKIRVTNATNLDGTLDQRTTSVFVSSESDTITFTYKFEFKKQGVPVQPNTAEPFISEMIWGITTGGYAMEIYNPGTDDLDLSRYMVVRGTSSQTWQSAVNTLIAVNNAGAFSTGDGLKIYKGQYVPSKRWAADGSLEAWSATPTVENPYLGRGFLKDDNQTDPWVKGNDVWVIGIGYGTSAQQAKIRAESNFIFRGTNLPGDSTENAWPKTKILHRETPIWITSNDRIWLLKVLNDSILNGTKSVVADASNYELIDRFEVKESKLAEKTVNATNYTLIRKPTVTKGNLEQIGGATETAESSEWIVKKNNEPGWNNDLAVANIGIHTMNPVSNYLSTVTSVVLKVKPGYRGDDLTITGNIASYTPASISMVLDKADSSQVFVFKRGASVLANDASLANNDVLEVTSGDGNAVTNYTLINSPLNNNTSLTAKAGSGLTVTGNKVTGVTVGMKLKDAVAKLVVNEKSVMNIYNADGSLQSLRVHNLDSLVLDVLVAENQTIEVVAENNDKAVYVFDFNLANNKAVLFSTILKINETEKLIENLPTNATVARLMSMVYTNKGATAKVFDRAGFEREYGYMNLDDVVIVTAQDGVTKVTYKTSTFISGYINVAESSALSVQLYPNPVTNVINIKGIELSTVKVYSLTGMMMLSKTNIYNDKVEVGQLPMGVYIIELTDKNGRIVNEKFLKK